MRSSVSVCLRLLKWVGGTVVVFFNTEIVVAEKRCEKPTES
jgi:hypothetical protein